MHEHQPWRKSYIDGDNIRFNPPPELITKNLGTTHIFLVHTGKCAGESAILGFRELLSQNGRFYEFHTFDANRCIYSALSILSKSDSYNPVVITTRDPIKRWESSFNWDYHNMFLSKGIQSFCGSSRYTSAAKLAQGIVNGCEEAIAIGKKGHMGLGISWYLPQDSLSLLSKCATYIIRTEHFDSDFRSFAFSHLRGLNISLDPAMTKRVQSYEPPKTKHAFKNLYPEGTFEEIDYSDSQIINVLSAYLSDDLIVHKELIKCFAMVANDSKEDSKLIPMASNKPC
jgi:hypothetical protein